MKVIIILIAFGELIIGNENRDRERVRGLFRIEVKGVVGCIFELKEEGKKGIGVKNGKDLELIKFS